MDQPLGRAVGNALEVVEAIELLRGGGPADLRALTVELTAEMLLLAGRAARPEDARRAVEAAIADGSGLAKLEEIVRAQGGDPAAIRDPTRLPRAPQVRPVPAPRGGFVAALDAEAIGLAAMALGAGRARVEDRVDPAVGILVLKKRGDPVAPGEPLCEVHHGVGGEPPDRVVERIQAAYRIAAAPPPERPLVLERMEEA